MSHKAKALALALALIAGTSSGALAQTDAPKPSAITVACVASAVGASVLATLTLFATPVTGNSGWEVSKPIMLKLMGACVVAAAGEAARQALTQ